MPSSTVPSWLWRDLDAFSPTPLWPMCGICDAVLAAYFSRFSIQLCRLSHKACKTCIGGLPAALHWIQGGADMCVGTDPHRGVPRVHYCVSRLRSKHTVGGRRASAWARAFFVTPPNFI